MNYLLIYEYQAMEYSNSSYDWDKFISDENVMKREEVEVFPGDRNGRWQQCPVGNTAFAGDDHFEYAIEASKPAIARFNVYHYSTNS